MKGNEFAQAEAIFHACADLPAEEVLAYLDRTCRADLGLRQQVLGWLEADRREGGFVAGVIGRAAETATAPEEDAVVRKSSVSGGQGGN